MLKKEAELIDAVTEFTLSREKRFTLEECIESIGLDAAPKQVEKIILQRDLAFPDRGDTFMPRPWFFRNAKVLIQPTEQELKDGILVPGHRFIPFYSPDLSPPKLRLTLPNVDPHQFELPLGNPVRDQLPRQTVTLPLNSIIIFYSLFGMQYFAEFLSHEDESNLDAIGNSIGTTDILVRLSVFDLNSFYKAHNFVSGDFLLCTLDDYQEGRFSLSYLPGSAVTQEKKQSFIRLLDKGFSRCFDRFSGPADISEQIAYGYFFAGRTAVTDPGLHLGGYVAESELVEIKSIETGTILWKKGAEPHFFKDFAPPERELVPPVGSLEEIIEDIGLSFGVEIIEAYMRDGLYQEEDLEFTIKRLLYKTRSLFASEEQEEAFYALLEDYWTRLQDEYRNPAHDAYASLRSKFLSLHHANLLWLRKMDEKEVMPHELPEREMMELRELMSYIESLIVLLNNAEQNVDPEISEETNDLDELIANIFDRMAYIDDFLGMEPDMSRSLRYYVVHIRNEDETPSRRRIRFPGNGTLRELHDILTLSFYRPKDPPHTFFIGDEEFADPTALEGRKGRLPYDDADFTLEAFDLSEGFSFRYLCGAGEKLKHTVKVEKVLSAMEVPEEERAYGVCLDGEGSGGLEQRPVDCGDINRRILRLMC